ncbi:MAG: glycoside hydrolase family 78 protein [Propionibacteriaceae bacterium]|jgi:alpha-L-rhamnosidase|nr:glycoside hydrolase family 78 protein [Propionibacteriaceae bacterium]
MWHAQFIGENKPCQEGDPAPYFRHDFQVKPELRSATLRVTALGIVVAYLNGSRVGDEVLAPGWTTYDKRLMVSSYDVTDLLTTGTNTLGAVVGEGWAVGAFLFNKVNHLYCDRPGLFMELELEYTDRTEWVGTQPGDDWLIGYGGTRANGLYDGETFDARLEPEGWCTPAFHPTTSTDDSKHWTPAAPFAWDLATLECPKTPPVRRLAEFAPVSITTGPSGNPVLDFGQNISGWVRLRIENPTLGQEITIWHAEAITPEGGLERETLRTAESVDRYICRGDAVETWEPSFTYHGFRYIEVQGWAGLPNVQDFTALATWSDMDETGWFECSNPLLNRLHDNALWSMRDNFVSIPTDCPQRNERLGWTGDLAAFLPTAAYLYDVRAVVESWLTDLIIAQKRVGNMPRSAPLVDPRPSQPTGLWGDSIVTIPWNLYGEYGDTDVLRCCWPTMVSYIDEVATLLSDKDLWDRGFQYGDWCDPDAPPTEPGEGKTDRYLVAQAYYARATALMVKIAILLGHADDVSKYATLNARVVEAFRRQWAPDGIVTGETTTGYSLAICFDLLPEDQRQRAGDRLAEIVASRDFIIASGFAGTPWVTEALTLTGHLDTAYSMLLQEKCPSFLYPITMGATTTWERWDAILPDGRLHRTGMTSLNHYALGAVNDWVHRRIGGLVNLEPGWKRFAISPYPGGGLTHARTAHVTPLGLASCEWRIESGQMTLTAIVPEGAHADVTFPGQNAPAPLTVKSGEHTWTYPYSG